MSRTTYESVRMDDNLPMRIIHFSHDNPIFLEDGNHYQFDGSTVHFVPPHWHRSIELSYVAHGTIHLRIGDKEQTFSDDSFFIINTGDIHEMSSTPTEEFELICFIISYDYIKGLIPTVDQFRFDMATTTEDYSALAALFRTVLVLYYENKPFSYLQIQSNLAEILYLLCQYHLLSENVQVTKKYVQTQQLNKQILEYIHLHYAENLTLEILATTFNFSREHFSRLFKETFGKTFLTYLNDYRLYCAFPDIVNSNKTIEAISIIHGFPSSKSLIKQFKNTYHETPLQYRKKRVVAILDHNEEKLHDGVRR